MGNSYLLSLVAVLLVLVRTQADSVTYSNEAVGLELSVQIQFTTSAAQTGGADIYVTIPGDFEVFGETVNITSADFNFNALKSVTASQTDLQISFSVVDDIANGVAYTFTIKNIYSPRAASSISSSVSVDVRATGSVTPNPVTVSQSYTSTDYSYGATVQTGPTSGTASSTYFIADRSYLNSNAYYTVSSVQLSSTGAFTADSTAALKVYTRAAGSDSLVFVSSYPFTIPAGSSPQTVNFNNGPRPLVPVNAVIGVYTTNSLALSTCAAPLCFGGHYGVSGSASATLSASSSWGPQEVAIVVTRTLARQSNDLVGLTVSNGTLSPNFQSNVPYYNVILPVGTNWITVSPSVDASTGASVTINLAGPIHLVPGTSTIFTITVKAEDPSVVDNVYKVNVTALGSTAASKPPFPCFGLVGLLNRVGYWSGQHFVNGVFDYSVCAATLILNPNALWFTQTFPVTLTISSNYLNSGMFFGLLLAGALPDPLPLNPPVPIVPFDVMTAVYMDQYGQNLPLSTSGGQFNFPNPDAPGLSKILLTGVVHAYGNTYTTIYDINVVIQKVSDVRTLLPNDLTNTIIQTVQVYSLSLLPTSDYGQFVITTSTVLGSPFDPWRMLVMSSDVDSSNNKPYIVVGFMDNQDQTRVSTATSASLQTLFANAVNQASSPYNAKLRTLTGNFALDFSVQATTDLDQSHNAQITPCDSGLWFLYGTTIPTSECGAIPDPLAGSAAADKHVLADTLVGLFVGFALAMIVAAFIYYKWIAKGHSSDTTTGKSGGMGTELNTMPNDTASAPVAVPAAQLTAPEDTSANTTSSS